MQSASAKSGSRPRPFPSHAREGGDACASDESAWLLGRGVRSLLRCDEAEVVEGIARYVISQHDKLRAGAEWVERKRGSKAPGVVALLGGVTRFLEVRRPGGRRGGAVWVARLGNERRALEGWPRLLPELGWAEIKFRRRPDASALFALARSAVRNWRRTISLARRLHRRHEFFKVLRVAELVAYYSRYLDLFRRGRFRLAVMSSHSNPHGIAFNLAARKCGVPVVLVTHGLPVRPVARLSYDLSVVHCEAARRTYLEEGCRLGRVFIHGRRQHHAPMPTGPLPEKLAVGIFLCKDVNEERLRAVVGRLLEDPRASRVTLRPHPKNLWVGLDEWVASLQGGRVMKSDGGSVFGDIESVDVVLGGNSSVLVDAVTAGRPAAYVPGLDYGSRDLHALVAHGLVCEFDERVGLDPDAMQRFYRRPGWPAVLRLFANVDEDESAVAARAAAAVRALAASSHCHPD